MTTKVNKNDYSVEQMLGGQYGIFHKDDSGLGSPVWGGDPADEDCYDITLANHIYNDWKGELDEFGKIFW